MNTRTVSGQVWRVAVIGVCIVSMLPAVTASAGDDGASRVDEESGNRVFGVVVSTDGSPLPGAIISLSGGKVKQRTVSVSDGAFSFASVPPGDYVVVFQASGKKKVKRKVPVSTEDVDLGTIALD